MSRPEQYHVTWRVYPHLDLLQLSGLLSGLAALDREGVISLSMKFFDEDIGASAAIMELDVVQCGTGQSRTVVLDFYDREDYVSSTALARSNVYFKRQIGPATRAACSTVERAKLRPLGLTVPGYSRNTWWLLGGALFGSIHSSRARTAFAGLGALGRYSFTEGKRWIGVDPTSDSLLRPTAERTSRIVFQPRLWEAEGENPEVYHDANTDRIASVRALRAAFQYTDSIGLIHSKIANELAPELQLDGFVPTSVYHEQLRSSLIAVNCVGLSGSLGWKLAEYLAAGDAIVSQPITKELLAPLEPNVHYLPYTTPAECVEQCRRLLDDRDFAAKMGATNRAYFLKWTRPRAHAMILLEQAFE